MNEVEKAAKFLEVMRLNDKSNLYFWGTVFCTVAFLASVVASFKIGMHFLFLAGACWVIARLILMPRGIEYNREARRIFDEIHKQ